MNEDASKVLLGWCQLAEGSRVKGSQGHNEPWQGPEETEEMVRILGEELPWRIGIAVVDGPTANRSVIFVADDASHPVHAVRLVLKARWKLRS